MTEHEVRLLAKSEFRAGLDLFSSTVHRPPLTDEHWARVHSRYDAKREWGAFVRGELSGTAMSFPSELAVPGGAILPASAVVWVGVRADRTRRGVLTALMNAQLSGARELGDPIAILHASEAQIYGRFGYGVATRARQVRLRKSEVQLRTDLPEDHGSVRILDMDTAQRLLPEVYRRIGLVRSGMMIRDDLWWAHRFSRMPDQVAVVHEDSSGATDGFALYQIQTGTSPNVEPGTLVLSDLQAANSAASLALWRFVLGVDLVSEVVAIDRPLDEPVEWWLTNRRACRVEDEYDDLWARLLDVPRALEQRRYAEAEPVRLEVRDPLLPDNSGTYRITPDGVRRSDQSPQLGLDVDALAALYLGDMTMSGLVAAQRVDVHNASAVAAADRLFATTEIPWCGTGF